MLPVLSFLLIAMHLEHHASFPCIVVPLTLAWHLFIRLDATNEVVYELVVEPVQEPQAREQQEETVERAPEEVANPADLQGKSRSITPNLSIPWFYVLCIKFSRS